MLGVHGAAAHQPAPPHPALRARHRPQTGRDTTCQPTHASGGPRDTEQALPSVDGHLAVTVDVHLPGHGACNESSDLLLAQ